MLRTPFLAQAISRFETLPSNMRAVLLLVVAMACFSTMAATIKHVGQSLHVTEIIVLRQAFMVIVMLPVILKTSPQDLKIVRKDLFFLRAFFAFFSMLTGLTAIINLPLATATTLSFTRTFFVTGLAVFILNETVGIRRVGALLVGFLGVLVIARPVDMFEHGFAGLDTNILLALLAAGTIATGQIIVRIQTRYERPTMMVAGQAIIIGLAMIPLAWFFWQTPTLEQLGLIAFAALLASFAQWLMVHAFKLAEATALAPFDYLRLIFSTTFGWILFSEWPDIFTWLGAAIIFSSTFYILRREAKLKKTRNEPNLD